MMFFYIPHSHMPFILFHLINGQHQKIIDELCSRDPLSNGNDYFLIAAEKSNRCILFDTNGNEKETVWTEPGGVMSTTLDWWVFLFAGLSVLLLSVAAL